MEAGLKDEESKVSYSKLLSSESQLKLNLLVLQKDKKQYKHLLFFPAGALFQSQAPNLLLFKNVCVYRRGCWLDAYDCVCPCPDPKDFDMTVIVRLAGLSCQT